MPLLPQVAMPLVRLLYKFWLDHKVPKRALDDILKADLEKEGNKKFGISSEQLAQLHCAVASSINDELIGAKLGLFLAKAELTLGNLVMKAATLEIGIDSLMLHSTMVSEAGRFNIEKAKGKAELTFQHFESVPFTNYQYDMIYASLVSWLEVLFPNDVNRIVLQLEGRDAIEPYAELLPCQAIEGEFTALLIPEDLMLVENPHANESVYQQCVKDANKIIAKRMERLELYSLVRHAIKECLMERRASQEDVANQLNLSVRNLQRRLKEAGTNYQSILDDSREALALTLIVDASVPLYEIAFLVGYTEPSAFYKAFKRWTGKRPGDYRESILAKKAELETN